MCESEFRALCETGPAWSSSIRPDDSWIVNVKLISRKMVVMNFQTEKNFDNCALASYVKIWKIFDIPQDGIFLFESKAIKDSTLNSIKKHYNFGLTKLMEVLPEFWQQSSNYKKKYM